MGAYLNVFHEGAEYNWERRHSKYDKQHVNTKEKNIKWGSYSPYYLLSFSCSLISVLKLLANGQYTNYQKVMGVLGITIFTIVIFAVFYWNTFNYEKEKLEIIKRWDSIKKNENEKKEISVDEKTASVRLAQGTDQVVFRSIMELVLLVIENSNNKEEAAEAIRNLSIIKHGDIE